MINFIITGHGDFSLGVLSATEMIAGEQEGIMAVPFYADDSLESYQNKLKDGINLLRENNNEIIIFTDLKGGTPFNQSMMVSVNMDDVFVVSGTNLAMLIEGIGLRFGDISVSELLSLLIESAKQGIDIGELPKIHATEVVGDGI